MRVKTSNRAHIVKAIVDKVKTIDSKLGSNGYSTKLFQNVHPRLILWDQISSFPCVCITAGDEEINYIPGRVKDRELQINIRIFVREPDPLQSLEAILSDIETILEEEGGRLSFIDRYGDARGITDMTMQSINTDEGVLAPLGIGEMRLSVTYIQ